MTFAGIFTAMSVLGKVIDTVRDYKDLESKEFKTDLIKALGSGTLLSTDGSITNLINKYTVNPTIIVSDSLRSNPNIDKIIELNMDLFCAYYMQAFEILRNINGVSDINMVIDMLGTQNLNVLKTASKTFERFSNESIDVDYLGELFSNESMFLSIEAEPNNKNRLVGVSDKDKGFKDQPGNIVLFRNLDVTTTVSYGADKDRKHTITIPINIRANVQFVNLDNIMLTLAPNSRDKSFDYRKDEYNSGGISFKNLMLCDDLIEQYKSTKLKDKAGLLDLIHNRELNANSKALYSGAIGFEKFYQMLVVSEEDRVLLSKQVNGNILEENYKQKLLEQGHYMSCTIVDENWDRGYVLTKDIRGRSDFSLKKLNNRKDGNVDLGEIIKALLVNKSPVF